MLRIWWFTASIARNLFTSTSVFICQHHIILRVETNPVEIVQLSHLFLTEWSLRKHEEIFVSDNNSVTCPDEVAYSWKFTKIGVCLYKTALTTNSETRHMRFGDHRVQMFNITALGVNHICACTVAALQNASWLLILSCWSLPLVTNSCRSDLSSRFDEYSDTSVQWTCSRE